MLLQFHGLEETVAATTVDALRAFRDAHTTPARVVVCISGGYDRDAVIETARERFGKVKAGPDIAATLACVTSGEAVEARKLEQTHLVFSGAAPAAGAADATASWIFSEIFGGGMASRLFQDVRETRGLVYAIHSWLDIYDDIGRVGVYAGCDAKNAKTVAQCVADAFEALAKDGPTDAELARAKAVVSAQTLMGAEAPLARVEARAAQVFLRGRLVPFSELRTRIAAVTSADVRRLAAAAIAGPVAASAIGPKSGLGAAGVFRARFA